MFFCVKILTLIFHTLKQACRPHLRRSADGCLDEACLRDALDERPVDLRVGVHAEEVALWVALKELPLTVHRAADALKREKLKDVISRRTDGDDVAAVVTVQEIDEIFDLPVAHKGIRVELVEVGHPHRLQLRN